jgi:hypothetical protein
MATSFSCPTQRGKTIMKKMKKFLLLNMLLIASFCSIESYANWYQDIINAINYQGDITNGLLYIMNSDQKDILSSQKDIDSLMKQVESHMQGNSGWGSYQSRDYQSYGASGQDWTSVMQTAGNGGGNGEFGQTINGIAAQFPTDTTVFNQSNSNSKSQLYYALQAKTVLATRAASQLDYNKIQNQISYQQMLQQQIEKTQDLKAAIDLSNRIQVEGNLINLEILRQVALNNQQQAMNEQAEVNGALSNAKFLIK